MPPDHTRPALAVAQGVAPAGREPSVRPVPSTARGRRTRAALLEASRRVFDRDGFVSAKVSDIAAEAGVAQGSFYNYFESKEDIFSELIAHVISTVLALTAHGAAGQTVFERVRLTIERYIESYWPMAGTLTALDEAACMFPQFRELANDHRAIFVARAERGIRRLQQTGEADSSIDPSIAAGALVAMTHNYVTTLWVVGEDLRKDIVARTLATIWVRAIGAQTDDQSVPNSREQTDG
jgi:AcrR family transcriptional regulator